MTDVDLEFSRVRAVLDRPTLRLMSRPTSAAVIAVFRTVFDRDVQYVPADRMHLQVEEHVARLQSTGARVPASEHGENEADARPNGRALCRDWVAAQWLVRSNSPDGDEQYSLTSHALEALNLVDALSADRALISESRLAMIVEAVHRWAASAEPDPDVQVRRIDAQIAELQAERERIARGEVTEVDDARMHDGYTNVADLIRQLPSDFKRVEEAVATMHRSIVEDFRQEVRPIGEILDDYLARTDDLMQATPEGRAFEGAFELLRDDALLLRLRDDIATILAHPFAESLGAGERRAFRNTVSILRQGIEDVLAQRRQLTATLRDQIVAHDVVRDRELDAVLRSVNRGLAAWIDSGSARDRVPLGLLPATAEVGTLRERFYDPDNEAVPPPIEEPDDDVFEELDVESLRRHGGPLLAELRAALRSAPDSVSAFHALPPEQRRPVELFGLAHLLTGNDDFETATHLVPHRTVRPDGETVTFRMPSASLTGAGADDQHDDDNGLEAR
ncbi:MULTISPECIES: DUF3375 family protein [unclassified Curtobacterium]|uniref:DUF3375 family protein n=1 Tax=unclassified Curtobacterium TaxID=257496 RepID=UPI001AE14C3B|nr:MULTISPECIES: DUF3375 family protein [unclassified Curtobacterium]MBP1300396.1 hypothetical protein [Curtobacterium sp. 1310]MDB6426767.1 DUF3375 family protein [Curtobacterium sp. 20TX0008]